LATTVIRREIAMMSAIARRVYFPRASFLLRETFLLASSCAVTLPIIQLITGLHFLRELRGVPGIEGQLANLELACFVGGLARDQLEVNHISGIASQMAGRDPALIVPLLR
jgi:hypothetical protein